MATQNWLDLNDFLATRATNLSPTKLYPFGPLGEYDSYNSLADYRANSGSDPTSTQDAGYKEWLASRVLGGMTPEQYIASQNEKIGLGPNNITGNDRGGFAWDPNTKKVLTRSFDDEFDPGSLVMAALLAAGTAGIGSWAGGAAGADVPWGVNAATESSAGGIPELGLIANPATANAAIGAGIPASMLSGGPGALTLASLGTPSIPSPSPIMPPAVPETTQQLKDWGMTEVSPGSWAMPGEVAGSLYEPLVQKVGPTAAKSLWQRFMDGDASALDVLGGAAPGLISEYFKSQQANNLSGSLTEIANQARADRSPFLDYAKSTLAGGPGAYATGAGSQALKGVLAKLSAGFGNPIGAPAALGIATDSALNNWGNDWRQAANIGLGGNYSQLATNAATAGAGTGGAGFGDAAASVFGKQPQSLSELMKSLNLTGLA